MYTVSNIHKKKAIQVERVSKIYRQRHHWVLKCLNLDYKEKIRFHPSLGYYWNPNSLQPIEAPSNVQSWFYVSDDAPANPSMGDADAAEYFSTSVDDLYEKKAHQSSKGLEYLIRSTIRLVKEVLGQ
jgi:hypothetical protein